MIRVNIVVEGRTEENFVKKVLYPYLFERNMIVTPRLVLLKRSGKSIARGGLRNYAQPKWDIRQWMEQDKSAYFATMFDFYVLPTDFPGMNSIPTGATALERVQHLEREFSIDLGNPRGFIPYLQLHEFEAILFSDIKILDDTLNTLTSVSKLSELLQIIKRFDNPELINDDSAKAPSKRLLHLYPTYHKNFFGELVAEMIGIDGIRSKCPHFNNWIERIEGLDSLA